MPYQGWSDGLYLAKQKSNIKPDLIDHYSVIDIGNLLNQPQGNPNIPIIIHQASPSLRVDGLSNTGSWEILEKVQDDDIINTKKRFQEAINNPAYNLVVNNCEQFARYVTTGVKESKQLQGVGAIIALGALLYSIWNRE